MLPTDGIKNCFFFSFGYNILFGHTIEKKKHLVYYFIIYSVEMYAYVA